MIVWGASGLFHDAALCVIRDGQLVFASSAERYSRLKNDRHLNKQLIDECLRFGAPDRIVWYETPWKKAARILLIDKKISYKNVKEYLNNLGIKAPIEFSDHHLSHLYSSLYTAPFCVDNSLGVVVDSVGEFASISLYHIKQHHEINRIYTQYYPNSLGLFYSAITDLVGLKPLEDEYILMGMSSYGKHSKYYNIFKNYFFDNNKLIVDCRYGCKGIWSSKEIEANKFDVAWAAQTVFENILINLIKKYLIQIKSNKIIYAGGCALNCKANSLLQLETDKLWIYPNPGDAGAAVGAALGYIGKSIKCNMFTGHDAGTVTDIDQIISWLKSNRAVGVMNGKAEFGPRALGHRSILADPRTSSIQREVNDIKGREQFRPFAPAVLKEYAKDYFKLSNPSNFCFMQYTAPCIQPRLIPGVVHVDSSSRVQVVDQNNPFLYRVLQAWYKETGCAVLLNTSLNTKGKPLINSREDMDELKGLKIITVHS